MKLNKLPFLIILFFSSCDDTHQAQEKPKTLCELVEDKINGCIGGKIPPLNSCSEEVSQRILDSDCATALRILRGEL